MKDEGAPLHILNLHVYYCKRSQSRRHSIEGCSRLEMADQANSRHPSTPIDMYDGGLTVLHRIATPML